LRDNRVSTGEACTSEEARGYRSNDGTGHGRFGSTNCPSIDMESLTTASYGRISGVGNSVTMVVRSVTIRALSKWFDRHRENVAETAFGPDHARLAGIGLQFTPQPQYLDIDAAIEDILVYPRGLQQMLA
jgi:hypothetical protein